jgi:hypothetical protein
MKMKKSELEKHFNKFEKWYLLNYEDLQGERKSKKKLKNKGR